MGIGMATYERMTALPGREALRKAEEVLTSRLPLKKVKEDAHSITLTGPDGTVTIEVHRHGLDTSVKAKTDQLRTSRLDYDTQFYMALLAYQPGERTN